MKKLYYVRHGLTQANVDDLWSGQMETNLTKEGIQQAINRGKAMREGGIKIDLIISSPLSRALHTAKLIAKEIGYPEDKIETNPLFVERSYGIHEGKPNSDFFKDHTYKDMDDAEGAESFADLQVRANRALKYLKTIDHDNILVVSHGTFSRALVRAVTNEPHTVEYTKELVRLGNAELLEII